jgi:hypothetical protein
MHIPGQDKVVIFFKTTYILRREDDHGRYERTIKGAIQERKS